MLGCCSAGTVESEWQGWQMQKSSVPAIGYGIMGITARLPAEWMICSALPGVLV